MTAPAGFRGLPIEGASPRDVAAVVNRMLVGGLNIGGSVTLTADQAATAVSDPRASGASRIMLFPATAAASAELAAGMLHVSSKTKGGFTLAHASNAQTDRTFDYVILG